MGRNESSQLVIGSLFLPIQPDDTSNRCTTCTFLWILFQKFFWLHKSNLMWNFGWITWQIMQINWLTYNSLTELDMN